MKALRTIACFCTLSLAWALGGCAGDLGAAREAAGKAAAFVGDMQDTTLTAIEQQRAVQQAEIARVAELQAAGQANLAMINQYRATWQGGNVKEATELYKAMSELTGDADLSKSVPFVLMAPLRSFDAPAIDRKSFTDLIAKFNKLEEGLSPIDRAKALAPFIEVVVKSYKDSVIKAKGEPSLVKADPNKPKDKALPVGTVLSIAAPAIDSTKAGQPELTVRQATGGGIASPPPTLKTLAPLDLGATTAIDRISSEVAPIEELSDNEAPVEGLLTALGNQ